MNNISGLISAFPTANLPSATDSKAGGENSAAPHDGRPDSFAAMLAGLSQPKDDAAAAGGTTIFKSFGSALPDTANSMPGEIPGSELTPAQLTPQSRRLAIANLQLQAPSQDDPAVVASEAAMKAGGAAPLVTRALLPITENTSNAQSSGTAKTQAPAAKVPNPTPNAKPAVNAATPPTVQADATADLADEQPAPAAPSTLGIGKRPPSTQSQSSDTEQQHKTDGDSASSSPTPNANPQPAVVMPIIVAPFANAPSAPAAPSPSQPRGAVASIDPGVAHNLSTQDRDPVDSTSDEPAPIKVDVVAQATHFAPMVSLSPVQQIVDATSSVLTSPMQTSQDSTASSSVAASASLNSLLATAQPSAPSIKTLDLQLEPPTLGTVSIKLNLSADGLAVEVQANQSTTVDLLQKDKQSLTQGLSGAGYTVSGVDISLAPANHAAAGFADQGAQQGSSGLPSGDAQGNGGSQTQNGGGHDSSRQQQRQSAYETPEAPRPAAQRSTGSGLYI
jgi:chemotaxis protein MotD